MGRVTGSWERPIQGVSQQADKDRIDGQCTLQENFIPSPLSGLIKRVGTRNVRRMINEPKDNTLWHSYERGDGEAYFIVIEPERYPKVFGQDGIQRSVTIASGVDATRLLKLRPDEDITMSTVADFTFIVDKTATVTVDSELSPVNPNTAILYCNFATYGRDYQVIIDGAVMANFTTPDGSEADMIEQVRTNYVMQQLFKQLEGNLKTVEVAPVVDDGLGAKSVNVSSSIAELVSATVTVSGEVIKDAGTSGSNVILPDGVDVDAGDSLTIVYEAVGAPPTDLVLEVHGNTMFIERPSGAPFTISTVDSADGNDLVAIQDKVRQLSNLPNTAPEGYVVKVQQNEGFESNAYWLRAEVDTSGTDQSGSTVRWVETTAQGVEYKFVKDTMPFVLISEANGTFTLDYGSWEDRRVGNDETNPFPSFVDQRLQSVGLFQNRLFFTSGESVVMSASGRFFDFFRETTQTESVADPLDAYADSSQINNILHHAVLDGDIVFFASNGQFLIDGDKPVTKDNLVFRQVTSYPFNSRAAPAVTGESIMFSFDSGDYSGIREMFTDSFTDTKRARPVTEHVAEYIKGTPTTLVSSPNINTIIVITDESDNEVYVYDWLWAGDQKVQSAMHKWVFNGKVTYARFINDNLYIVIERSDGLYLEYIPISSDADDSGLDFSVKLDRRVTATAEYFPSQGYYRFFIPYEPDEEKAVVVRGEGCYEDDKGTSVVFEKLGIYHITYDDLSENGAPVELIVGEEFQSRYVPTRPYIRDQNGRAIGLDRFTLGKVTINYESIGSVTTYVSDRSSRREWRYEYNGRMFGGWNNRVGFAPLDSGSFSVPIRLRAEQSNIEIVTSDYRPFIIRDMEWEGMFKQRGRRL